MKSDAKKAIGSILFACSLNSVRSPMAEGLAKNLFGRRVYIDSAGLRKSSRDPFALAVLQELGIDHGDDAPHTLDEVDVESFDLVVTLSPEAKDRVGQLVTATAVEHLHWPIDDPTNTEGSRELRLHAYRTVRDTIRGLIRERLGPRVARTG